MDYIVLKRKRLGMTQGTHASQNLVGLELLHMIFHQEAFNYNAVAPNEIFSIPCHTFLSKVI
jgi:hypothetical protein